MTTFKYKSLIFLSGILFVCTQVRAQEYAQLEFDNYPGWGEQRVILSADKKVATFVPEDAIDTADARGTLHVFSQSFGGGTSTEMFEMAAMVAVGVADREVIRKGATGKDGCIVNFHNPRFEVVNRIPRRYTDFSTSCQGAIVSVGTAMTTKVNRKIATLLRFVPVPDIDARSSINDSGTALRFESPASEIEKRLVEARAFFALVGR